MRLFLHTYNYAAVRRILYMALALVGAEKATRDPHRCLVEHGGANPQRRTHRLSYAKTAQHPSAHHPRSLPSG